MYLLDTNIWLEVLLGQERAAEASKLLTSVPTNALHITDFALHSIGVILTRLKRLATLRDFLADVGGANPVQVVRLDLSEVRCLPAISHKFGLDFDDAYQYAAARASGLQLVSFDTDFDRTDLPRKTPAELL
jgi:uncharacterized protein